MTAVIIRSATVKGTVFLFFICMLLKIRGKILYLRLLYTYMQKNSSYKLLFRLSNLLAAHLSAVQYEPYNPIAAIAKAMYG